MASDEQMAVEGTEVELLLAQEMMSLLGGLCESTDPIFVSMAAVEDGGGLGRWSESESSKENENERMIGCF